MRSEIAGEGATVGARCSEKETAGAGGVGRDTGAGGGVGEERGKSRGGVADGARIGVSSDATIFAAAPLGVGLGRRRGASCGNGAGAAFLGDEALADLREGRGGISTTGVALTGFEPADLVAKVRADKSIVPAFPPA